MKGQRPIIDVLGILLPVNVHAANKNDTLAACDALSSASEKYHQFLLIHVMQVIEEPPPLNLPMRSSILHFIISLKRLKTFGRFYRNTGLLSAPSRG